MIFLNNYLYMEYQLGWFPHKFIYEMMKTFIYKQSSYGKRFYKESNKNEDNIAKQKGHIIVLMNKLFNCLPEKTNKRFITSLEKFIKNNQRGFNIETISNYFKREEFPINKGGEVSGEVQDLWDKIREGVKESVEDEISELFYPYISLYENIHKIFYNNAREDDVMFLNDLNKNVKDLWNEKKISVIELYFRLSTKFQHYLIDEFQDTNVLQWRNIDKLIENSLSTGGTLFYVGDKKQAIYSFRAGDVRLFEAIKIEMQNFQIVEDYLINNWRSQKHIVEFNNFIFSEDNLNNFVKKLGQEKNNTYILEFTEEDNFEKIWKNSQQNYCEQNDKGYVETQYIEGDNKEQRNEKIKEQCLLKIKEALKQYHLADIAILTRTNQEIEDVTQWLLGEEGFEVSSERTLNLMQNDRVKEIFEFIKFLNNPMDNVSFMRWILGDIFLERRSVRI